MLKDEILQKTQGAHKISFSFFRHTCHELPFVTLDMQKIGFRLMTKNLLAQVKNESRGYRMHCKFYPARSHQRIHPEIVKLFVGRISKDNQIILRYGCRIFNVQLVIRISLNAFKLSAHNPLIQFFSKHHPRPVILTSWVSIAINKYGRFLMRQSLNFLSMSLLSTSYISNSRGICPSACVAQLRQGS